MPEPIVAPVFPPGVFSKPKPTPVVAKAAPEPEIDRHGEVCDNLRREIKELKGRRTLGQKQVATLLRSMRTLEELERGDAMMRAHDFWLQQLYLFLPEFSYRAVSMWAQHGTINEAPTSRQYSARKDLAERMIEVANTPSFTIGDRYMLSDEAREALLEAAEIARGLSNERCGEIQLFIAGTRVGNNPLR